MLLGEKEVSDDAEICLDWSLFLQMEPGEEVCGGLSERRGNLQPSDPGLTPGPPYPIAKEAFALLFIFLFPVLCSAL